MIQFQENTWTDRRTNERMEGGTEGQKDGQRNK